MAGDLKQKFDFPGKLNMEVSFEKMKPGDYSGANNVQFITNDTQSTGSHIPMIGNELAFNLGSVTTQNKKWRIYTPQDAVNAAGGIFLYDQNGNLFPTINGQAQPMVWNRNQTLANQAISILALFTTIDGAGISAVTAGTDYVDIVPGGVSFYDIGLRSTTAPVTPTLTTTELEAKTILEAHDVTVAGELVDIASNDLFDDLMMLSTTQKNLPFVLPAISSVSVVAAAAPVNQQYQVVTASAHGLTTGMRVVTSGIVYTTGANTINPNGIWIVTVVNATTFNLTEWYDIDPGAHFVYTSGGIITLYEKSIGEIGVAQKDLNTDTWTYTRLLRTTSWDFRTKKQPDFRVSERTSSKDSHYWTNGYEVPRCFYYRRPADGVFSASAYSSITGTGDLDGAIDQINPNGFYSYETVGEETKLLLSGTNAALSFVSQSQSGGKIPCGNSRYLFRFLSESLASTEWSDLSNPINAYVAPNNGDPSLIIGDAPGTVTGKINNFQITGIVPGLFKYVELAFINYVGNAIEGFIIKRVLLDSVSTSLFISHTGTETDMVSLDLGTINVRNAKIETAANMNVVDKRMVLSRITLAQQADLTAWVQAFKHTLFKKSIDSVRGAPQGTLRMAEYQSPENVHRNMGYMQNDVYRMGFKVRFRKTQQLSDVFYCDDIAFTTYGTNLKPDGVTLASASNRRTAAGGLSNLDLTDSSGVTTTVYVPYVNFNSIDLDYLIDGVKVRDLIDQIIPMRAECVPEVLASGVAALSVYGSANEDSVSGNAWIISSFYPATNPYGGTSADIMEYPFISGRDGIGGAPDNPQYPNNSGAFGDNMTANRRFAAFYSPDIWFGHTSISYSASAKILNYGAPVYVAFNNGFASGPPDAKSNWTQVSGLTNILNGSVQIQTPSDVVLVNKGSSVLIGGTTFHKDSAITDTTAGANGYGHSATGFLFHVPADFTNPAGGTDYGLRYMQYYLPLTNKYGDITTTKYVTCGEAISISPSSSSPMNIDVFGGDTFTQISYFKHRYGNTLDSGFAGGLSFYSQNRINVQMKQKSVSQTGNLFPGIASATWLQYPTDTDGTQGEAYQEGYTIRNQVKTDVAFDPAIEQFTDLPQTFMWTDPKLQDSPIDGYRKILPGNRHDLDAVNGPIVHHGKSGSELISWQYKAFMRQYFNSRGTLEVKSISEVVIGDGQVMNRDGVTMSLFGSFHKWSIIHGVSANGDDVYMWINTGMKNVVHYSSNGTLTVSDEWMKSFFANNLTWVEGKDMPADEEGIHGVYDQRFNNFIWTVRGRRKTNNTWSALVDYSSIGQLIYYVPSVFSTFEKTGELFLVKFGSGPSSTVVTPVAVYPLPNVVSTITGTTVLTVTTASPHLLVTGDQVKFRSVSGLSADINEVLRTVTVTGASTFTVTVSALTNSYVASSGSIVEVNPKYWTFIPHTNNNYYNEYSVIYNGFKVGFITPTTAKPRIYNKWKNTYLSARPISPVSKIFEHNKGSYFTWYLDGGVSQQEKGYIEGVLNMYPEQTKWFKSICVNSDVAPDGMTFETKDHESFLTGAEFEQYEGSFLSPIKEDSTVTATNPTGRNDSNTSLLFGKYLKARFNFAVGVYQKLSDFVINFDVSDIIK